jgi:uncharacterized membrane protein HdeD (DUF308 family)
MTAHWAGPVGGRPFGRAGFGSLAGAESGLIPDALKRARRLLLGVGILAVLAGLAAIVVPVIASVTMTIFIGWVLMVLGIVSLVRALRSHAPRSVKSWRLLNAVLAFLVGFYLVVFPLEGTITLTFLLAVWFFGTGAFSLAAAWRHRGEPGAGWMALDGAVSAVLGLLIALELPSSAAWAIGVLVGIYLLWWGADALAGWWLLRGRPDPLTGTG